MAGLFDSLRDAADILRRARSGGEALKAIVPNAWLTRQILNEGSSPAAAGSPAEVAVELRKLRNQLKLEAINDRGEVDYAGLKGSPTHQSLNQASALLRSVDAGTLVTDEERLAFWINLYNVLAIHGVLELGIVDSVMEVPSFFSVVAYRVGDVVVTLDEIENGILRRNAPHPATGRPLFKDDDPRLSLCPSRVDPRIHAALVCASTSCPPVAFYEAERLDAQLRAATENYVAAEVVVDSDAQVVRIPITFRYYRQDFNGTEGIRDFILEHAHGEQQDALSSAFGRGLRFDYHRYDWSLNSTV